MGINTYTDAVKKPKPSEVPQSQPIPGKKMVENSAGGFTFQIDDWDRLDRFLILGTEGGSYYTSEKALTRDNAKAVERCIKADGLRTVARIVEISTEGRAPKNDSAIFALGMCLKLGNEQVRKAASENVTRVCRIGTHLFQLAEVVKALGGWGRATKTAFAKFYDRPAEPLGHQLVKYQSRNGWSHRDVLRKIHVKPQNEPQKLALRWAVGKLTEEELAKKSIAKHVPQAIIGFEEAKKATSAKEVIKLIKDYELPREAIPTNWLNDVDVWEALLMSGDGMPMTAMIRNLAKMTSLGLLKPLSTATKFVVNRLADKQLLTEARIHPLNVLLALRTYGQGHGEKGSLTWTPVPQINAALDDAFYESFKFIEPTGKNFLLGIDVSASMTSPASGTILTCCEVATAMAMVAVRTEPNSYAMAFDQGFRDLKISAKDSLDQALKKTTAINGGGTDCAIPMEYALKNKLEVDCFCVYTDNETWAGRIHPSEALKKYRKGMSRPAKSVVAALTATPFTIADPNDAGMLDIVGFDSAMPAIISSFVK